VAVIEIKPADRTAFEAIFVKQSIISLKSYEDKNQLLKNKQFQKKIKVIFLA